MASLELEFELEIPSLDLAPPIGLPPELAGIDVRYHTGPYFYGWRPDTGDEIDLPTSDPSATTRLRDSAFVEPEKESVTCECPSCGYRWQQQR